MLSAIPGSTMVGDPQHIERSETQGQAVRHGERRHHRKPIAPADRGDDHGQQEQKMIGTIDDVLDAVVQKGCERRETAAEERVARGIGLEDCDVRLPRTRHLDGHLRFAGASAEQGRRRGERPRYIREIDATQDDRIIAELRVFVRLRGHDPIERRGTRIALLRDSKPRAVLRLDVFSVRLPLGERKSPVTIIVHALQCRHRHGHDAKRRLVEEVDRDGLLRQQMRLRTRGAKQRTERRQNFDESQSSYPSGSD